MQSQCPLPGNASLCLVAQTTFAPPVQIDVCRNMFCTWSWQVKIPPQSMKMFSWENPHSKSSDIFQRFSMFDYQRMRDLEPSIHCHSQLKLFYNPGKINNEELNLQILQARKFFVWFSHQPSHLSCFAIHGAPRFRSLRLFYKVSPSKTLIYRPFDIHKPYWFHQLINWAVEKGL